MTEQSKVEKYVGKEHPPQFDTEIVDEVLAFVAAISTATLREVDGLELNIRHNRKRVRDLQLLPSDPERDRKLEWYQQQVRDAFKRVEEQEERGKDQFDGISLSQILWMLWGMAVKMRSGIDEDALAMANALEEFTEGDATWQKTLDAINASLTKMNRR